LLLAHPPNRTFSWNTYLRLFSRRLELFILLPLNQALCAV